MKKPYRLKDISVVNDSCVIDISMKRMERQANKAQYMIDSMIMTHMIPYMPMVTGTFINLTSAISKSMAGSGYICAAAPPYGRFLYYGKTMVSPSTGSTWAGYGEKKVLVDQYSGMTNAKENLEYSKTAHPKVTAEWFEAAKKAHGKNWLKMFKQWAGGG